MRRFTGYVVLVSLIFAFILWYTTFVIRPANFWLMMTFNTVFLGAVALPRIGVRSLRNDCTINKVLIGIVAAGLLYGIFWLGHLGLIAIHNHTGLLPQRAENLNAVYANQGHVAPGLVALLLFFPIGFGEEVYWRGLVQKYLSSRWGTVAAFVATVLLYTAVHVSTGNPVLILASLVCGLFWSGLYQFTGSLVPVIVSHMIWDPFVFIILPVR
jgi:uncharacterized protein